MLKISEVAELAGISKRTLQYYDGIGLLCPVKTDSGYRLYSGKNIDDLQQILFFRELGFSLKEISNIMDRESFDREEALRAQRKMLEEKRSNLKRMVETIDKTLESIRGGVTMDDKEKFNGFDFSSADHFEKEARKRWGNKAVDDAKSSLEGDKENMNSEMNRIYEALAGIRHLDPESDDAQDAIGQWFHFLNRIGSYSLDAFRGLGEMYMADERFKNNIDKFGTGLAAFMMKAMRIYADKNK